MSQRRTGLLAAGMFASVCIASSTAAAQSAPIENRDRGLRASGDASAVWGPRDREAFFNFTDYEHNDLRLTRLRLAAEWRIRSGLSFLGQAQTENGDTVDAVAAYLRWRPWSARGLVIQAGRIPPVVGAYPRHAYSADNAVIGSPLAYQYLTSLRPDALPDSVDNLLRMRGRGWQSSFPVGSAALRPGLALFSPRWDTGVEVGWRRQILNLSGAVTMGAPAEPRLHPTNDGRQWSGRAAVHLASGLTAGISGARGSWIDRKVLDLIAPDRRQSTQSIVAGDVELGRGRWLIRGEGVRAVFAVPIASGAIPVAHLAAASVFGDVRYRLHPRWQAGVRVERLAFSGVRGTLNGGLVTSWDAPVSRVETVLGFRVRRTIDLRGGWQYDWRDGGRVHERGYPTLQILTWF